jgi:hypothetical protein
MMKPLFPKTSIIRALARFSFFFSIISRSSHRSHRRFGFSEGSLVASMLRSMMNNEEKIFLRQLKRPVHRDELVFVVHLWSRVAWLQSFFGAEFRTKCFSPSSFSNVKTFQLDLLSHRRDVSKTVCQSVIRIS